MTAIATEYEIGQEYDEDGVRFRVTEDGKLQCLGCNNAERQYEKVSGVKGHWNLHCPGNPIRAEADAKRRDAQKASSEPAVRSRRGLRQRGFDRAPSAFEQVRERPGGMLGGPAAYYLNPSGATIREILVVYPNGAGDKKSGKNRDYYRQRQRERGLEYIGPTLTDAGVQRMLEVMEANKEDYVLFLQEEIVEAQAVIENSDRPEIRDQQKKRRDQFRRLLEIAQAPIDAKALVAEMDDIIKGQKLAALTAGQREAILILIDDPAARARIDRLVNAYSSRTSSADLGDGSSMRVEITNAGPDEGF